MASPLRRQVRSEAQLRYGGPLADLLAGRRTLARQRRSDERGAEITAHGIEAGARRSIPELKRIYDDADRTRTQAAAQINMATGAATGPSQALALALRADRATAAEDSAGERRAAQADAVASERRAVEGLAYTKRNLLSDYRANRADLMAKTRDVHREMGAFAQGRLGELQSQQAQADFEQQKFAAEQGYRGAQLQQGQERIDIARGVDPVTGKRLSGKAKVPRYGPGALTQAQENAVRDSIEKARSYVDQLTHKGGLKPDVIRGLLVQGHKTKGGTTIPAFPKQVVRAAFELHAQGFLSPDTVKTLHSRGLHIPKPWRPPKRGTPQGLTHDVLTQTKKLAGALALR